MRITWEKYALNLAEAASSRSEDPYKKVGACLLREDHTVAALGYNGPPPGLDIDWSTKEVRRPFVVHAEVNALRYVKPGEATLLACTLMPCHSCMLAIAAFGIRQVVYHEEFNPERQNRDAVLELAERCGIEVWKL